MALKNLFDMVKADRYTADGREAIIKAQEAETEDKVYQIGEISQKTGLQKTANGWVKPKSGKQPGAKQPDESARIAASKEARAKKSQELEQKAAGDFAKYKDLPPVQRKDALGAASHEGISIGTTQRSMEGMGWDLIQADDKVNVYGKPDGSKAIMKHDGKKITEVSYEGPGSKPGRDRPALKKEDHVKLAKEVLSNTSATDPGWTAEEIAKEWKLGKADAEEVKKEFDNLRKGSSGSKPVAGNNLPDIPDFKGMESGDYDKKLRAEGWTTGGWEGNGTHASAIFKKGDRTIRVNEGQPGKITSVQEISKAAAQDAAPRVLTGDTRIRVRKA